MNNEEAYPASQSCSQQVAQFVFTGGKFSEMLNETRGIIYLFFNSNKQYQISSDKLFSHKNSILSIG